MFRDVFCESLTNESRALFIPTMLVTSCRAVFRVLRAFCQTCNVALARYNFLFDLRYNGIRVAREAEREELKLRSSRAAYGKSAI